MFRGTRSLPPYKVFRFNKKTRSVIKRIDMLMQSLVLLDPEWVYIVSKRFLHISLWLFSSSNEAKIYIPQDWSLKKDHLSLETSKILVWLIYCVSSLNLNRNWLAVFEVYLLEQPSGDLLRAVWRWQHQGERPTKRLAFSGDQGAFCF